MGSLPKLLGLLFILQFGDIHGEVETTMGSLPKLLGLLFILQFGDIHGDTNCVINGKEYTCGVNDYSNFNCQSFSCHCDGKWFTSPRYEPYCSKCTVSNDPHITTFDGARYDWHGDCTYVLAEEEGGVSYVHSKFTKCNAKSIATCVDDVTFKPRDGPIIKIKNRNKVLTLGSPSKAEVVIKEYRQTITTSGRQMQVLKGPENQEYPVLAYYFGDCLHIIAVHTKDFLVKICKHSVKIFSPRTKFFIKKPRNIFGMCGNPDDGPANDDLKLRNGKVVDNPGGCCFDHIVNSTFAKEYQATSASCSAAPGRRRRSIAPGKKLCDASDKEKAEYFRVCTELIGKEKSLSEEKKLYFIDTCAFDQCIITKTGADTKEWLNQYTDLMEQEVFQQENLNIISDEDYFILDSDFSDPGPDNVETTTHAPAVCQFECGNGICTRPNECTCSQGFTGNTCNKPICHFKCGEGQCTSPNTCTCSNGYTGDTCDTPICPGGCVHGQCRKPNECTCSAGYTGVTCDKPVCQFECGNGTCTSPNECTCSPGYTGDTCDKRYCSEAVGFFKVPNSTNQCFKYLNTSPHISWDTAKSRCLDQGLVLAKPLDPVPLRKFIVETYGDNKYMWIGGRGTGTSVEWIRDRLTLSRHNSAWYPNDHGTSTSNCLKLLTFEIDLQQQPKRPYYMEPCSWKTLRYALCELVME